MLTCFIAICFMSHKTVRDIKILLFIALRLVTVFEYTPNHQYPVVTYNFVSLIPKVMQKITLKLYYIFVRKILIIYCGCLYNPNELYKTQKRLLHISMCELFTFQKKSTNSPKINEFNTKIQKFVSSTKKK